MFKLKLVLCELLHFLGARNKTSRWVDLNRFGIEGLPSVSPLMVERLVASVEELDESLAKVWKSTDGCDSRIFGIESLVPEIFELAEALDVERLGRKFYGTNELAWFCMYGHIIFSDQGLGSGGGWHRDSLFQRQLKIVVYLTDADEKNGCFQYMRGSHAWRSVAMVQKFLGHQHHRYEESDISNLAHADMLQTINVKGRAGDSFMVDTRGIHRGMPLLQSERKALTFYLYRRKIPDHMKQELQ